MTLVLQSHGIDLYHSYESAWKTKLMFLWFTGVHWTCCSALTKSVPPHEKDLNRVVVFCGRLVRTFVSL